MRLVSVLHWLACWQSDVQQTDIPQTDMNTAVMRVFLWSGVVLVAALIVAQGLIMGFIPGPSPSLSAKEVAQVFIDRKNSILLGTLLQCICWCFYGTWAIPIIVFIRKMERGVPALTYASLVNVGGGWVFFILIPMTWAVIAFRAETLDPAIIQIMNDWVWFDCSSLGHRSRSGCSSSRRPSSMTTTRCRCTRAGWRSSMSGAAC